MAAPTRTETATATAATAAAAAKVGGVDEALDATHIPDTGGQVRPGEISVALDGCQAGAKLERKRADVDSWTSDGSGHDKDDVYTSLRAQLCTAPEQPDAEGQGTATSARSNMHRRAQYSHPVPAHEGGMSCIDEHGATSVGAHDSLLQRVRIPPDQPPLQLEAESDKPAAHAALGNRALSWLLGQPVSHPDLIAEEAAEAEDGNGMGASGLREALRSRETGGGGRSESGDDGGGGGSGSGRGKRRNSGSGGSGGGDIGTGTWQRLWSAPFFERRALHVSAQGARDRLLPLLRLSSIDALISANVSTASASAMAATAAMTAASASMATTTVPLRNWHDLALTRTVWRDGVEWSGYWGADNATVSLPTLKSAVVAGMSLLLNQVEARQASVGALCGAIEAATLVPCNANAYLTPTNGRAFEAHFDWMDALVLQIDGSKEWNLWPPLVELPRAGLKRKPTRQEVAALKTPTKLTLKAGDVLFLPRGVLHSAVTPSYEAQSLHLTVGLLIGESTFESLAHAAVECAAGVVAATTAVAETEAATAATAATAAAAVAEVEEEAAAEKETTDGVAAAAAPSDCASIARMHGAVTRMHADDFAVLGALLRAVASASNDGGRQLRRALPLTVPTRSLLADACFRATHASGIDALRPSLLSAETAIAVACGWSESAALSERDGADMYRLSPKRCGFKSARKARGKARAARSPLPPQAWPHAEAIVEFLQASLPFAIESVRERARAAVGRRQAERRTSLRLHAERMRAQNL